MLSFTIRALVDTFYAVCHSPCLGLVLCMTMAQNFTIAQGDLNKVEATCIEQESSWKDKKVYAYVDEMPEYPGGPAAAVNFFTSRYRIHTDEELQLSFRFSLLISPKGKVVEVSINGKSEEEYSRAEIRAIEVLRKMPRWRPGKCAGERVWVQTSLKISI